MSLKAFHLIFIVASVVLAFGFSAWSFESYRATGESIDLLFGVLSILAGVALIWYGKYFLKKLKRISYL
jgi:hypothetical protein